MTDPSEQLGDEVDGEIEQWDGDMRDVWEVNLVSSRDRAAPIVQEIEVVRGL